MSRIRRNDKQYRSMRRQARVRDMDHRDLYRYDPYPTAYNSTMRGKSPNRKMNGRSMGACGSCGSRRRR